MFRYILLTYIFIFMSSCSTNNSVVQNPITNEKPKPGLFSKDSEKGISLSKILGYLLSKFNQLCNSIIFGFIIGSLGVIWPWKSTLSLENEYKIVRYLPEFNYETFYAIIFIFTGIAIVAFLSSYEKK